MERSTGFGGWRPKEAPDGIGTVTLEGAVISTPVDVFVAVERAMWWKRWTKWRRRNRNMFWMILIDWCRVFSVLRNNSVYHWSTGSLPLLKYKSIFQIDHFPNSVENFYWIFGIKLNYWTT